MVVVGDCDGGDHGGGEVDHHGASKQVTHFYFWWQ